MSERPMTDHDIRLQFRRGELSCEALCWQSDWHWKVKLNEKRLVCMKKEHWNGSRWQVCPREELPGPVWDWITATLKELSQVVAGAGDMGIRI